MSIHAACAGTGSGMQHTLFDNLTTLVHFFSSTPAYFLLVASSKLSPIPSSCRKVAALFGRFEDERYAMIDL